MVISQEEDDDKALETAEMAELIRTSVSTDEEVRGLCRDLQVLGRSEFKLLLKWRLKVKKAIDAKVKELKKAAGEVCLHPSHSLVQEPTCDYSVNSTPTLVCCFDYETFCTLTVALLLLS